MEIIRELLEYVNQQFNTFGSRDEMLIKLKDGLELVLQRLTNPLQGKEIYLNPQWIDATKYRPKTDQLIVFRAKDKGINIGKVQGLGMEVGPEKYYYEIEFFGSAKNIPVNEEDVTQWLPLYETTSLLIESPKNLLENMIGYINDFDGADYEQMDQTKFCAMLSFFETQIKIILEKLKCEYH